MGDGYDLISLHTCVKFSKTEKKMIIKTNLKEMPAAENPCTGIRGRSRHILSLNGASPLSAATFP